MANAPDPMLALMQGQKDSATPGGVAPPPDNPTEGMSGVTSPPMAGPMSTPEPKLGDREAAMTNLGIVADLLEQCLPAFGSETPEGQKILNAIRTVSGMLGPRKNKTNELQQSEILQLMQTLPKAGGTPPELKGMQNAPPVPGMPPPPGGGMPPPM